MTSSRLKGKVLHICKLRRFRKPQLATLVFLGITVAFGLIITSWFAGIGVVEQFFENIHFLQETPPIWLEVPMVMGEYLLAPTVVLLLIVVAITKISPQPQTWSRVAVVSILLALTIRYVLWRSLSTLNLSNPFDGAFSLGLLFMEILLILSNSFQVYLILKVKPRHRQADKMAVNVINGSYTPSVDILIPTYNEPTTILRRTIIGCQALDYANKKIYLLDDTRRPEMKNLAQELGCEYITRPNNLHAKAGNLNHALSKTSGELIAVFDADFIPTKNFLIRTLGFFQKQKIALVQTHQSFYNPDPVARNLGLENVITQEVEIFSRHYQLLRDSLETSLCYGSSFVARRSALEETGGFVTESLSEDYFTGIRLSAKGYKVIYLGESLSAGLSAENMTAHIGQRLRWTRGSLQAFFINTNPLTIPGLRFSQRLAHFEGLFQWFTSVFRVVFLLMPLAYTFIGVIPLWTTSSEWLYFFVPYYLVQLFSFSWLNYRSRSALLSDIYSVAQCIPISITVIQTMLNPFSEGFKVTPKGTQRNRFYFNWRLAWPLIILFLATLVSLWHSLDIYLTSNLEAIPLTSNQAQIYQMASFVWIWNLYNLLMIGIALFVLVDVPKPSLYEWFNLQRLVEIQINSHNQRSQEVKKPHNHSTKLWGITTSISEVGAEVALTKGEFPSIKIGETLPVKLKILEEEIYLQGKITNTRFSDKFPTVQIIFEDLILSQERRLVEILFCRPWQWKRHNTPGELHALWLLLKILLKPKVLFDRNPKASKVIVSQA
ncbi:MAG: glycosyltransferase [Symploca sp. SIO2E9]|nr:glycosyltransferase [Symploca sp. SIO2E9]